MQERWPARILSNKKVGLEMTYSRWLTDEWKEWSGDLLLSETASAGGLLDPSAIRSIWEQHQSHRIDHGRALWGLMNFLTWHDLYLGSGDPSSHMPEVRPARGQEASS